MRRKNTRNRNVYKLYGGKMKSVLLIGLGRFGRHIAKTLDELGHQTMAIDVKEDRVNAVLPYVTSAQIGDSTNEDFLDTLGVGNFDVCFVAIGDDFQNSLETTSLLKEKGAKMVVSRAARDVHAKFLLRNGADQVVYPERELANWTAIRYTANHISDYIEVGEGCSIIEVEIPKEWIGKEIQDLDLRRKYKINVLAIKKENDMNLQVMPDTVLKEGANLLVLEKHTTYKSVSIFKLKVIGI